MKPVTLHSDLNLARWAVRTLAALTVLAVGRGLYEWLAPSYLPFSGRLAWVGEAAYAIAGPLEVALLWGLLAVICMTAAKLIWRHTPKSPGQRWWG